MFREMLEDLRKRYLLRYVTDRASPQGPRIVIGDRELINFSSNDYLGLANHPDLVRVAVGSMERFGFGAGASRLLGGGCTEHRKLEEAIACFKGVEAALLFNSGYAANTGIIPCLAGEGDVIFSDELNHASIVDGCRLSRARTVVYRHEDADHLASLFRETPVGTGHGRVVVTDTVFSMDGDIAPLPQLYALCEQHHAFLYIDDAHGTGVLGGGKGALTHFSMPVTESIVQMGTFSKALGSFGAFVAGGIDVVAWIRNTARPFIFSTALPVPVVAASLAALELIERSPALITDLWRKREYLVEALKKAGYDIGGSETPIIPLKLKRVEDALTLSSHLSDNGIYAPAIRPPTVGIPRVRITVTAVHSDEDLGRLVRALEAF